MIFIYYYIITLLFEKICFAAPLFHLNLKLKTLEDQVIVTGFHSSLIIF